MTTVANPAHATDIRPFGLFQAIGLTPNATTAAMPMSASRGVLDAGRATDVEQVDR
jgi:hypothetical protein